jgi:hypothetical protein
MADGKNRIVVYRDWIGTFESLTDEEAGKLIKHLFRYVNDLNPKSPDRLTALLFEPIKQALKRDLRKYEAICLRNRENGEQGGRPKNNPKKPKKPSGLITNPKNPDEPDKDKDKDKDKDNNDIIKREWNRWKQYKKDEFNFKYKSGVSEQAAKDELLKLAQNDADGLGALEETAIKIIEQSIANGWKGFFKLKADGRDKKDNGATTEEIASIVASKFGSDR